MGQMTATEIFQFIRSYGWEPEMEEIVQWLKEDSLIQADSEGIMDERWMYRFNDWRRIKGTANEPGIDPQTKIDRLLEKIDHLKKEIEDLKEKNLQLEKQLGLDPF